MLSCATLRGVARWSIPLTLQNVWTVAFQPVQDIIAEFSDEGHWFGRVLGGGDTDRVAFDPAGFEVVGVFSAILP
jgi:hypothetical protein